MGVLHTGFPLGAPTHTHTPLIGNKMILPTLRPLQRNSPSPAKGLRDVVLWSQLLAPQRLHRLRVLGVGLFPGGGSVLPYRTDGHVLPYRTDRRSGLWDLSLMDDFHNVKAVLPCWHLTYLVIPCQVGAALRPAFTSETPPDITARACQVRGSKGKAQETPEQPVTGEAEAGSLHEPKPACATSWAPSSRFFLQSHSHVSTPFSFPSDLWETAASHPQLPGAPGCESRVY